MKKIITFLTINGRAEEAANYYVSVFQNSKITNILRCGANGPGPEGSALTITFELNGQEFIILNYGPEDPFTRATSFLIQCENQQEIDELWNKFSDGGKAYACGWIADKYGVTWQVCPAKVLEMIQDCDSNKAARVMKSMMSMIKFDIAELERAHAG
jgi:predicted 3-demethylubiquinone-9 3-methyltransferase (glyoxalase superfamily)